MSTVLFKPIETKLQPFYKSSVLATLRSTFFGKNTDENRLLRKQSELAQNLVSNLEKLTTYGDDLNFEIQQKIKNTLDSYDFFKSTLDSNIEDDAFKESLHQLLEINKSTLNG